MIFFLTLFVEAFSLGEKQKLNFHPDDAILDIYLALNPHKWEADAMELETLALDVEQAYGVNFNDIWRDDITLGELFSVVHKSRLVT